MKPIELAGRLFPADEATKFSINLMPNAAYEPAACIRTSLEAARRVGFDTRRIMFEFTETERELAVLRSAGIDLFQGFLFARPALESLPAVSFRA